MNLSVRFSNAEHIKHVAEDAPNEPCTSQELIS